MMAVFVMVFATLQDSAPGRRVESVPAVDLRRYAGLWHEVARLPNRFQARCVGETTATYEPLPNGELRVVNSCRDAEQRLIRVEGRARLADRRGPASRLKVRFAPEILAFLPMVWGDYWILDLTDDYGAALVGTPSRKYLWVLARTPQLDEATYQRLVATAAAQGFDVARLVRSR
jgi:apolipoprotein D and lipocalin family protein